MNNKNRTLALIVCAFSIILPLFGQTPTASFATWKDNKKAAYTIIHDDYSNYVTGIYQYADPIATARGIKLCFGAITSACGATEWANARTMMSHGHECVNHSHNHLCGGSSSQCSGLSTYGSANFATELDLSTQLIETNTGVRPRFFIHPYDASSGTILNYLTSIGYLGSRAGSQLNINQSSFTNFMNLNFYVYDGTATALSSLNTAVNTAISSGGYAIREFHGIADGSWAAMTVANYTSHLDYVKSKITDGSLWSATATEAITYKMQRDAFNPVVNYNATANTLVVSFTALKTINPSVLRTPITLNLNTTGFSSPILSATQNGAAVPITKTGNIVSINIYPHVGNVVFNLTGGTPQPQPVNVTNLTPTPQINAMLLGWTNPTSAFDEVMIVAKALSGFTSVPSGTTFTANANFTGAGSTFEGGKVVYRGFGSSMTVTGLTSGTNYFFRVYTRLGSIWSNGVEVNAFPAANVTPTPSNVSNLTATPQINAASIKWINPSSAFDEVLVVAKEASGFLTKPSGTTYNSDSNFGGTGSSFEGGKVVYRGTGTTVSVSNLIANRTYYFRVYTRLGTNWSNGVEVTAIPTAGSTTPPPCAADGKLIHRIWNNITLNNYDIVDLTNDPRYPNSPSSVQNITQFSTFSTVSYYGDRVLGYIVPQVTGNYTFWVAGADDVQLYLSTNESAANKKLICNIPDYTSLGEYTRYPTQKSASINLTAGQFYYVELLHIQSEGEAHFEVQWQTPTNTIRSPIPSTSLSSKTCNSATPLLLASAQTAAFSGSLKGDVGVLNWATRSADENDYFVLEKADEITGAFKQLDVINAQGSDKSMQAFSYEDKQLLDGDNFYRLKTVSQKSSIVSPLFQYTEVINIRYTRPESYAVFPNPANDYFLIDLSLAEGKTVDVSLVNLLGKVVKTQRIDTPSVLYRFNLDNLDSGQYFLRIQPHGKRLVMKKLIIMK